MTTRKLHYKAIMEPVAEHTGSPGDIFYDPDVAELRMFDGNAGGMLITGGGGGTGAVKPTYVDPAPVGGNYMTVNTVNYSTVLVTGELTNNFTLNLQADEFGSPENGVTYTGSMTVIFTNGVGNSYGITGLRANGSWGGGDTLIAGTPATGKTVLAQVNVVVIGNGTPNPDKVGYVAYTTVNN